MRQEEEIVFSIEFEFYLRVKMDRGVEAWMLDVEGMMYRCSSNGNRSAILTLMVQTEEGIIETIYTFALGFFAAAQHDIREGRGLGEQGFTRIQDWQPSIRAAQPIPIPNPLHRQPNKAIAAKSPNPSVSLGSCHHAVNYVTLISIRRCVHMLYRSVACKVKSHTL